MMLALFAEGDNGKTMIGIDPILGLDAAQREGTRAVGPLTAIWWTGPSPVATSVATCSS